MDVLGEGEINLRENCLVGRRQQPVEENGKVPIGVFDSACGCMGHNTPSAGILLAIRQNTVISAADSV